MKFWEALGQNLGDLASRCSGSHFQAQLVDAGGFAENGKKLYSDFHLSKISKSNNGFNGLRRVKNKHSS